jgi:hypothetical protein
LGGLGKIERDDIEALFGEPNPVACFAVGDDERLARLRQQPLAGGEEVVRCFAENVFRNAEAALPARVFAQVCLLSVSGDEEHAVDRRSGRH